ncbi:MAG TPA: transglycosylase SLT domain-containing protein [Ktedonobacterales bacterium]
MLISDLLRRLRALPPKRQAGLLAGCAALCSFALTLLLPMGALLPAPRALLGGDYGDSTAGAAGQGWSSIVILTPDPSTPTAVPCPTYTGERPGRDEVSRALERAADAYHLPRNLLFAVAWQESSWRQDARSCDGGVGLMQIQNSTWEWLNAQQAPACALRQTSYDPMTLQGNADLGAKFLAWLSCYYTYWGGNGGVSVSAPGNMTSAWYYQQAGLRLPDTRKADGSPNTESLCAAVLDDPAYPEYEALHAASAEVWSCPYDATSDDPTLLDFVLSAYNQGVHRTNDSGIQNWGYVRSVEAYISLFAIGVLP